MNIQAVIDNDLALEIARNAIEEALVERRDNCMSILRGNGLCIKEYDGEPSSIIRMSHEEAMIIGLTAILKESQNGLHN